MITFDWPWALLILPLPLLLRWLIPAAKQQQAAIRLPASHPMQHLQHNNNMDGNTQPIARIVLIIIWLALVISATRPLWLGEPVALPTSGRDLMMAVDLSGSMQRKDMEVQGQQVNRLQAIKYIASDFIERREGDRLGLILFGTQAYMQSPLTFDRQTVKTLLLESRINMAGEKTAIGDAVGLTIKRLRDQPTESRVLILLTDGANTAGEVSPIQAAQLAAQQEVTIYTIGIGAEVMIEPGIFGTSFGSRKINPSKDLDEATLTQMAELTGGRYFRARNVEELQKIYQILDKLEPIEQDEETFRPVKSLFYYPLATAFILSLLLTLILYPWNSIINTVSSKLEGNS